MLKKTGRCNSLGATGIKVTNSNKKQNKNAAMEMW